MFRSAFFAAVAMASSSALLLYLDAATVAPVA